MTLLRRLFGPARAREGREEGEAPGRAEHAGRAGEVYLLSGESLLAVVSGAAEVAGRVFRPGETLAVPRGRRVPVELLSDARVRVSGGGKPWQRSPGRTIPPGWEAFARKIAAGGRRTVLILGETDTGKSFLAVYLANRLLAAGRRVAVLDADTGQSVVGPPATLGLAVMERPAVFLDELRPSALYFTGAYSPGAGFLEFGAGLSALFRKAAGAADTVIVNTPGWVQGDGGRLLCRSEAAILAPDAVALLERDGELRYIARRFPGVAEKLAVPSAVLPRSALERKALRERAAAAYFRAARAVELPLSRVATDRCYFRSGVPLATGPFNAPLCGRPVLWAERLGGREGLLLASGRPLSPGELRRVRGQGTGAGVKVIVAGQEKHLEVALNDARGEVLALGILERIDYRAGRCRILTPLAPRLENRVKVLQFGLVRCAPDGTEEGPVAPGSF